MITPSGWLTKAVFSLSLSLSLSLSRTHTHTHTHTHTYKCTHLTYSTHAHTCTGTHINTHQVLTFSQKHHQQLVQYHPGVTRWAPMDSNGRTYKPYKRSIVMQIYSHCGHHSVTQNTLLNPDTQSREIVTYVYKLASFQ